MGQRKYSRDGYFANSYEIVEMLEFTHFTKFYSFDRDTENGQQKVQIDRIQVVVAIHIVPGNN